MLCVCKPLESLETHTDHTATYLPHKAVAEVSKDKEPIGRECADSIGSKVS